VAAFEQMALVGLSAAQIVRRTAGRRDEVDAALTVAASQTARQAAADNPQLTLAQAATIAEFDGDHAAVTRLLATHSSQFDHTAQWLRDQRDLNAARQVAAGLWEASGLAIVDRIGYGPVPECRLAQLRLADAAHGEQITPSQHAACAGHAAFLEQTYLDDQDPDDPDDPAGAGDLDQDDSDDPDTGAEPELVWAPVYICTDWRAYGHEPLWGAVAKPAAEADAETVRALRREIIAGNRAWRAAETVRRDWLRQFAGRKTAPKTGAAFIAAELVHGNKITYAVQRGSGMARELLGTGPVSGSGAQRTDALSELIEAAGDSRALMLALVLVLAAYEQATDTDSWRRPDAGTARYLRYLADQGYGLSDVERLACGEQPTGLEQQ